MKKITFLLSFVLVAFLSNAQLKITFEDAEIGTSGGATAVWSAGSVDIAANAYLTGNSSSKVLHVMNTGYLGVYFSNVPLPANSTTLYSKLTMKYLVIGGTDTNYPTLDIFSAPNSWTMGDTEKIGSVAWSGLWGTAEIGVWKTVEFNFANVLLNPFPAGNLILKLSKSNTEYLIDDIELVSTLPATPIVNVNDFEANTIGDVLNMKRWNTTDGSATVEASPTNSSNKSAHIITSNYDAILKLNVVLPVDKILAHYDQLSFDIYSVAGASNNYKKMLIYVDNTKVYEDADYPLQASDATWTRKEYALSSLAGGNAFVLDLGISTDGGNYYMDNIKLRQIATGLNTEATNHVLIYSRTGDMLRFIQNVSKLNIFDVNGKQLVKFNDVDNVNLAGFKNGIYILKAEINGDKFITKIIK